MSVAATTPPKPVSFHLTIPISKIDEEKRLVRGVATAETLDTHGDKIDYKSAKAAFEKWRGNVREMHQPVAVGKAVEVEFDDVAKQIVVTSYVSKGAPDTWAKVLDGTLKDYSIGAKGVRTVAKATEVSDPNVILTEMGELSLVDAGALQGSGFQIIKVADTGELVDAQPAEEDEKKPDETPAEPVPAEGGIAPASATAGAGSDGGAPEVVAALPAAVVEKADTPTRVYVVGALRPIMKLLGDTATIPERLAKLREVVGVTVSLEKRVEAYDIRNALAAISYLEELIASELWERSDAQASGNTAAAAEDQAQLDMLKSSVELLLSFLISEVMSQFDEASTTATIAASRAAVVKTLPKPGLQLVDGGVPSVAEDVTKLSTALTAAQGELAEAKGTIQKQQESFAGLEARMQALEEAPMRGGPVTRAPGVVEKAIGANTEADATDPAAQIAALQVLAKSARTDAERNFVAEAITAVQMRTGHGIAVVARPQ